VRRRAAFLAAVLGVACSSGSGGPAAPKPSINPVRPPAATAVFRLGLEPVAHFALVRTDSTTVVMPNGGEQGQVFSRTLLFTITARPGTTGQAIEIIIDSVRTDEIGLLPMASVDSLRGTRWKGLLSPNGRLGPLTPSRGTLLGIQLGGQLRQLIPFLPAAGVRAGDTWSDSTSDTVQVNAFGGRDSGIVHYTAATQDVPPAPAALLVTATRHATVTGSAMQGGGTLTLAGTDSATIVYTLASPGRLMAVEGNDLSLLTITVPAMGQTLPATQRARFTLTRLP
jgi:hypothetical protein